MRNFAFADSTLEEESVFAEVSWLEVPWEALEAGVSGVPPQLASIMVNAMGARMSSFLFSVCSLNNGFCYREAMV